MSSQTYQRELSTAFREALFAQATNQALAQLVTLRLTLKDGSAETLRLTNIPAAR